MGVRTPDIGGHASTSEVAEEVVNRVRTKVEIWSTLGSPPGSGGRARCKIRCRSSPPKSADLQGFRLAGAPGRRGREVPSGAAGSLRTHVPLRPTTPPERAARPRARRRRPRFRAAARRGRSRGPARAGAGRRASPPPRVARRAAPTPGRGGTARTAVRVPRAGSAEPRAVNPGHHNDWLPFWKAAAPVTEPAGSNSSSNTARELRNPRRIDAIH